MKRDDESGITTRCCASELLRIKDEEVIKERKREREQSSRIIEIHMPSQVSEAEGELGESVVAAWIHYEPAHADAPCNHLCQMERCGSLAHQTPPACQGRCMDTPTLLKLIPNTYSARNKARPSGPLSYTPSQFSLSEPSVSEASPQAQLFLEPHLVGARWCANGPFHPIKWRSLKGPASVCAHSRVNNPPTRRPSTVRRRTQQPVHSSFFTAPSWDVIPRLQEPYESSHLLNVPVNAIIG